MRTPPIHGPIPRSAKNKAAKNTLFSGLLLVMGMSEPLAVILSFMADTKHVVLIHGSFSRGEQLAPARAAFEERGYTAHTPTLRHHELPSTRTR